jgi:LPXTG-motif cell wall-anchored protein
VSGPAIDVLLGIPMQSVISGDTFYFADNYLAQILAIDLTTGVISTLAGTAATRGITGNGGPAADALMDSPRGLVIDAPGTMYVAEFGPCSVRKISLGGDSGPTTTLSPTTTPSPTTPKPVTPKPTTPNPTSVNSEARLPDTGSPSMPLGLVAVVLVSTGLVVHRRRGAAIRRSDR